MFHDYCVDLDISSTCINAQGLVSEMGGAILCKAVKENDLGGGVKNQC